MFGSWKIYLAIGAAIAMWYAYGWGIEVINTYNSNIAKIAMLERTAVLTESRLASKDLVIERYRAAVDQSQCKARINYLLKNPDLLKKVDPFNPNAGG